MDDARTKQTQSTTNSSFNGPSGERDRLGLSEALELLEMLEPYRDVLLKMRGESLVTQVTELLVTISTRDIDSLHNFIALLSNNTETVLNGFEAAQKFTVLWMEQEGTVLVEAGLQSGVL